MDRAERRARRERKRAKMWRVAKHVWGQDDELAQLSAVKLADTPVRCTSRCCKPRDWEGLSFTDLRQMEKAMT